MGLLHGLADIAAIILTLELVVLLVVPAFLIGFFGRKGMKWVLGKYSWAVEKLHTILGTANKAVHKAEDVAVTPLIVTVGFWHGAGVTLRSLRRRADQPLSRLRRSA